MWASARSKHPIPTLMVPRHAIATQLSFRQIIMMATLGSNDLSVPGSDGPQFRACKVCAISKARCVPRLQSQSGKCERLNKECLPGQITERKRRRPRTNRTAQLEQKLDGLVSLLTTSQQQSAPALSMGSVPNSSLPQMQRTILDPLTPQSMGSDPRNWVDNTVTPRLGPMLDPPQITPSPDDQLRLFQTSMLPHFPFVIIPAGITAEELRISKPFLFENIIMATSYFDVAFQLKLRSQILQNISEQILFQGKKSLDLIQGLLVFIAWYHHQLGLAPLMTNMVQIAVALAFDLGLHKFQTSTDNHDQFIEAMRSFNDKRIRQPRTLEERRTFLGLFCCTRSLSVNIGKIEPLQNTAYVEECCLEIERRQEFSTDQFLVFQVRLQYITDSATRSFPANGVDYWGNLGSASVVMLVKSLEADLERLKNTLEPSVIQSSLFQIYFANISMHVVEIALRKAPSAESTQAISNQHRLVLLTACLQNTSTFFQKWLSLPGSIYPHLPMTVFAFLPYACVTLAMLNLFHYDGWDLEHVRRTLPFSSTMDELAQKYKEASQETDSSGADGWSACRKVALKLERLREWYDARNAARQEVRGAGNLERLVDATPRDVSSEATMEALDNGFWDEIMAWTAFEELL